MDSTGQETFVFDIFSLSSRESKSQGPTRAAVLSGAANVAIFVSAPQFYCFAVNAPLRFCIFNPVFVFLYICVFARVLIFVTGTHFLRFACNRMF